LLKKGDTLLIPTPPNDKHLFVCLSDAFGQSEEIILASITTKRSKSDLSCVLTNSDHPFIQKESVVAYRFVRRERMQVLLRYLGSGMYVQKESMTKEIVEKIIEGASISKFAPIWLSRKLDELN